jgi:hypothetical protein
LRYNHVPQGCVDQEIVPVATAQTVGGPICQRGDDVDPTCAPRAQQANGEDVSFLVLKCPNRRPTFDSCQPKTSADLAMSIRLGSQRRTAMGCVLVGSDSAEVACQIDGAGNCQMNRNSPIIRLTAPRSGLAVVNLDAQPAGGCGDFEMRYFEQTAQ